LRVLKNNPIYRKVEQWEIYDRLAGSGIYSDTDKKFLPTERYDWTLLTEIELFKQAVKNRERVLDIGCGTGHPSLYITGEVGSIIGIDKSERMIEIAKRRLRKGGLRNVTFRVGDAEKLDFPDESFDAAILCGSLATITNKEKCLYEVKRVLKKNGIVACAEANWLYQAAHERRFYGEGAFTLTSEGLIKYRYVERTLHPHREVDYRCIIDPESQLARKLLSNTHFLKHKTLKTKMTIREVEEHCKHIEYDEQEKFDAETITQLFKHHGFTAISVHGYGVMYDILKSVNLTEEMAPYMRKLCRAEAKTSKLLNPQKTEMIFLTCKKNHRKV